MIKLKSKAHEIDWEGLMRVYFENVQTNVYGVELKGKKVLMTFEIGSQIESKKLQLKGDQDKQPLHL